MAVFLKKWHCQQKQQSIIMPEEDMALDLYMAALIGLRDYVQKNKFKGVVLGLSGGIDSALALAIAVDALGSEKVHALMLPSPYTSAESLEDATDIAKRLDVFLQNIPIAPAMQACAEMLSPCFENTVPYTMPDTTEENIQSRLRGLLLMAYSNKLGYMVVTTGNKSEMSVGYATLYGDMCGGYNPLKDLYKMDVYALCAWRNSTVPLQALCAKTQIIPQRILEKAPSAELRPNQKDEDSLPPYPLLDAILQQFIEQGKTKADIAENMQVPQETIEKVWNLLVRAEYKRRQAPLGVKTSSRAFGKDWRLPITNGY